MPALSNPVLYAKLQAALPPGTVFSTGAGDIHPAQVEIPGFGPVRIYLWTLTRDQSAPGARPPGEFKIQLIIPGQTKGTRSSLLLDGEFTVLLGYSPDFGVFVAWEAPLYMNFAYSTNVQAREELLVEARDGGWAVGSPRLLKGSTEVRVAFSPGNLFHYLRTAHQADRRNVDGAWREAFFLLRAPNAPHPLEQEPEAVEEQILLHRQRIMATRLARDGKFAPRVKEQYGHACAVCSLQLEIVESAHIIPVYETSSTDAIWNGIALCPNHHRLFDARVFVIDQALEVRADHSAVQFLRDSSRAQGLEWVTDFEGRRIREPQFFLSDRQLHDKMVDALGRRTALIGDLAL